MGDDAIAEAEAPNPPHRVELSPFWLGVFPVTNAEYDAFARSTGAALPATFGDERFGRAGQPVVGVGWREAVAYCAWAGGALPTEAQWELAARGSQGRRYPWGDESPDEARAWFAQDWNRGRPSPVGAHPAGVGPFGHHDLAGNVWEWCLDAWRPEAHRERPALGRDPCPQAATRVRPLRGGCWRSIDCKLQGAYRNWSHEAARHTTIGFRLCLPAGRGAGA
jgi:formylglycine-generating enzyme required for sulfatase activity